MAAELEKQVLNYRLQNIYDLSTSNRQFLLKFAVPEKKHYVVVDPGFRIHATEFARSTTQTPSGFVTKLRKHLRTRRLVEMRLAPENRILVMTFMEDRSLHLVFEFFAGGNMILLNKDYKILALQRVVSATDTKSHRCAVGEIYPLDEAMSGFELGEDDITADRVRQWVGLTANTTAVDRDDGEATLGPAKSKKSAIPLKKLLAINARSVVAGLIDEALAEQGCDGSTKTVSEDSIGDIVTAMKVAYVRSRELVSQSPVPGWIVWKKTGEDEKLCEDFEPYEVEVPADSDLVTEKTETFAMAVDKYFSTFESTKLILKSATTQQAAERKLRAAREEKEKRVRGLTAVQEKSHMMGTALQTHANRVDEVMNAVKDLLEQGMDWKDMENLIDLERNKGNPVAQMIALPLNLAKSKISVLLPDPADERDPFDESDSDSDSDESGSDASSDSELDDDSQAPSSGPKTIKVEIDLTKSVWANATDYFDIEKQAAAKQERTEKQADMAYKSAERKIRRDLEHAVTKDQAAAAGGLHAIREPFWFEKFFWFRSSEGYLCLAGRDSFQNELLLRRYFRRNDMFVHTDISGSSVVIIRNHLNSPDIPPSTLIQAGTFSVASSNKAWESKMISSAWCVTRADVPRLLPDGEPMNVDSVAVSVKKNYLPPSRLDMGLAFLWLVPSRSGTETQGGANGPSQAADDDSDSDAFPDTKVDSDDEDFPDTQLDSDEEEFPDTQVDSDTEHMETKTADENVEMESEDHDGKALEDIAELNQSSESSPAPSEAETAANRGNAQEGHDASEQPEVLNDSESTVRLRHLSAKERRQLRKQRASATPTPEPEPNPESDSGVLDIEKQLDALRTSSSKASKTSNASDQKPPTVRGKKGKQKKAQKYKDQDEDERQQRMEILGSTKGVERRAAAEKAAEEKKQREEQIRRERKRRQQEAEKKRLQDLEREDEEGVDQSSMGFPTDRLVDRVQPGEEIIGVVPFFAPWQALQKVKYKVKVQPGAVKKGKAVKDVIRCILGAKVDATAQNTDFPWPSELDFIKTLKEADVVLQIAVPKVKLTLPASANAKDKGKQAKGSSKSSSNRRK